MTPYRLILTLESPSGEILKTANLGEPDTASKANDMFDIARQAPYGLAQMMAALQEAFCGYGSDKPTDVSADDLDEVADGLGSTYVDVLGWTKNPRMLGECFGSFD